MKQITLVWLRSTNACDDAVQAWRDHGCETDPITVVNLAMKMNRFDWANWLIVRVMTYKQYVSYAVFAAEQVLDIFEKKYPNNKRPRLAIEAAKRCIKAPTKKNKTAADAAYTAAAHAAYAADAADAAYAVGAAGAAYAAAYAAAGAAHAAYAAAAAHAAYAAYAAGAADARKEIRKRSIEYGIKLLRKG
jgi:hypothetical protein